MNIRYLLTFVFEKKENRKCIRTYIFACIIGIINISGNAGY